MGLHAVVTGAGGFVGGFVAHWLAAHGCEVTAVTRKPIGSAAVAGMTWRQSDLRAEDSLPSRFDALVHCAAETPERCPDPLNIYRRNIDACESVFRQARSAVARSVVFLSSMSAYGSVTADVVTEDTPPGNLDEYGRAKRDGELLLQSCVGEGLPSGLAIRLPGTVGKGSHDNFLSVALERVLSGQALKGRNPDALFNNVVYVGDLALFLHSWIAAPRRGYTVTNLGATDPLPFRDVLSLLFSLSYREKRLDFEPGGKKPFLVSLDRAVSIGYRPSTVRASLEAFVRDCL